MVFPILVGIIVASYIIGFLGLYYNSFVRTLGGMFMMVCGIILLAQGIEGVTSLITVALGSITIGIGGWFTVMDLFKDDDAGMDNLDEEED